MKFILLEHNQMDTRFRIAIGDVVQTLSARCGTGGGNVPMIIEVHDESEDEEG